MKEDNQPTPTSENSPYRPASTPKAYVKPVDMPIPEVMTEKQFKSERLSRRISIVSSIIAGLLFLSPVCVFVWAAYASYDPKNSVSGFIVFLFTIIGIVIAGVVLHTVGKEIEKALKETEKLKSNYMKNKREKK